MVVSGVSNPAERAIRLEQGILSLHDITIASLVLGFMVAGVGIFHGVRVAVFRMSLEIIIFSKNLHKRY